MIRESYYYPILKVAAELREFNHSKKLVSNFSESSFNPLVTMSQSNLLRYVVKPSNCECDPNELEWQYYEFN